MQKSIHHTPGHMTFLDTHGFKMLSAKGLYRLVKDLAG